MSELVTLLDDGADSGGLALAVSGDLLNDLRVNGEQMVQYAGGVRAANVRPIARQNIVNRITVGVTHAPASDPDTAKLNAVTLIAALTAKLATATLLELAFGSITLRLSEATVETYDLYPRGTTVFASYTFVGGDLAQYIAP